MLDQPVHFDHEDVTERLSQGIPAGMRVKLPPYPLLGGDHLQFSVVAPNGRCAASIHFNTGLNLDDSCQLTHANAFEPAAPYKGLNTILLHNIVGWMAEIGYNRMTVDTIDFGCYVWAHFFSIDAHRYDPSGELADLIHDDLNAIRHKLPEDDYVQVSGVLSGLRADDPLVFHRLIDMGLSLDYNEQDGRDYKNMRLDELTDAGQLKTIPLALYLLHWRCWSGNMDMGNGAERTRLARKANDYKAYNARLKV